MLALAALAAACGGTASSPDPGPFDSSREALARSSGGSSLAVVPNPVASRAAMRVTGCGYAAGGSVTVNDSGPAGARSWTATADASGCLASDASAGTDAGSHTVKTYQQLKRGGPPSLVAQASVTVLPAPLGVIGERYYWRWDATKNCVSEDDTLDWSAAGSLAPGQSFSFTPRYPDCNDPRAVMGKVTASSGANLQLSTVVPASDRYSADPSQAGKPIVASMSGGVARICMFPDTSFKPNAGYTITVTNLGTTAVNDVTVTGKDYNDWPMFYWNECLGADADGDGWSDSYEHTMAQLVASANDFVGKGTNYLASCGTSQPNDEFDFWPPDFDDDGVVTQADVDLLTSHLGEGNGVPWASISPNSTDPGYFWNHVGAWNRFDLTGDGWVDSKDLAIVQGLLGQRCSP
jgi:hypothetical protein